LAPAAAAAEGRGGGALFYFEVAGFGIRISGFRVLDPGFGFRVSEFGFWVSGLGFGIQDSSVGCRVLGVGVGCRVLGFKYLAKGLFIVRGLLAPAAAAAEGRGDGASFGIRDSGFGIRDCVSGIGFMAYLSVGVYWHRLRLLWEDTETAAGLEVPDPDGPVP
jgi:hypothetical protein